jgi:acyl-CoA synthetase (AMP-forming)/AMP-acid ligase II
LARVASTTLSPAAPGAHQRPARRPHRHRRLERLSGRGRERARLPPEGAEWEIINYLAQKIVRYELRRSVEFIDAPLRDDAGKVRRSRMRDEAIVRLATNAKPTTNA